MIAPQPDQGRIRVCLIDDHSVVRHGLRGYPELVEDIEAVGEAADGRSALDMVAASVADGDLDAEFGPDLVGLELDQPAGSQDLRVVEEPARRGRAVIAVCSRSTICTAVLAADALACLDEDADFADRLARAVRAVATLRTPEPPA